MDRPSEPDLSFDRAEFDAHQKECTLCREPISSAYFLVNGQCACGKCTEGLQAMPGGQGGGAGRVLRALMFGGAAAALCSAVWYAILALTGYEIGLLAIAVGFIVGYAVQMGAAGRGGFVYQALAIGLTYSAIVITYVPGIVTSLQTPELPTEMVLADGTVPDVATETPVEAQEQLNSADIPIPTVLAVIIAVPLAYAMPFLTFFEDLGSGVLGLIIIGIGLYEAWKFNRKRPLNIDGPHELHAV